MTAKLPPLQPFPAFVYQSIEPARRELLCEWAKYYALQAVRDALERLLKDTENYFDCSSREHANRIRALLKEYSDV